MPETAAALAGIAVLALATYVTRITGYFLGGRIAADSPAGRVLDALPGAALAGVLALSLANASVIDLAAVAIAVAVFLWRGHTLLAIGIGLLIAVANAHLGG